MKAIQLSETKKTPKVILDKEAEEFLFAGRSLPEDPNEFYFTIFEWLDEYLKFPKLETNIVFEMDYMNTASSKMFLKLFYKLKKAIKQGRNINIKWIYDKDDEELFEAGSDFADMVDIPIEMVRRKTEII